MDYKLLKWKNSNYEIILTVSKEDFDWLKSAVLVNFQKDMSVQWFRKGHVPLNMVEQNVKPEYLKVWIYEEAIHQWVNKVLDENSDVRFIWQIYDLNQKEEWEKVQLSFKLDVYPEVEVKNDNWKIYELKPIDEAVTEKEIDDAINNIKRQYADYKEVEAVTMDSIFKVRFEYKDKDGNVLDKWSAILAKEEFEEFPELKTIFLNRKKSEKFEIDYDKKLPILLQSKKEIATPKKMEFDIIDIREVVLPEFTEENIVKFFEKDGLKTEQELREKISEVIKTQKHETWLVQTIEDFIAKSMESLNVEIPKTIIDEEIKSRYQSLQDRLGWEAKFKEYLEKQWQENREKMANDINNASKESLQKFLVFRKLVELMELGQIDWEKQFEAEEKLYQRLLEWLAGKKSDKKETKKSKK